MNRVEFMEQLERLLWDISESDRMDAITYYTDYFDEAGIENEADVIQEIGSPEKVAEMIKTDLNTTGNERAEYTEQGYSDGRSGVNPNTPIRREGRYQDPKEKRKIPWALIIVLFIFATPMLLGVGAGLLGGLIGIVAGVFGIIIAAVAGGAGCLIAGIVCFVVGIFRIGFQPLDGLVTLGVGSLLVAVGLLLLVLFVWIAFKWVPALFRICVNWCQKLFHHGERRNMT